MNSLDEQYKGLLGTVLYGGKEKSDRTGTGTLSVFGRQIRHDMSKGFPILTTKKVAFKTMVTELKWFLRGDTNIKYLVDNGCNIWNGDAYKKYCKLQVPHDHFETQEEFIELIKTDDEFANKWGELGPIYGSQWRDVNGIDQLANLMENIKNDPFSRRLIINSWNVSELNQMTLPPCHYAFQVYVVEGHLDLLWTQRSADMFLGVPFNLASYGLLLLVLCHELNLRPGKIIGHFGDIHLYQNHLSQAYQQVKAATYELPQVKILSSDILKGEFEYELIDYKHSPVISAKLNN